MTLSPTRLHEIKQMCEHQFGTVPYEDVLGLIDQIEELEKALLGEQFMTWRGWENLTCDDQFQIANSIASNLGYDLVPEQGIDLIKETE